MKRVLLTGATGFLGRHILERLLAGGWCEVHAACRRPPADDLRSVRWHVADLRDPAAAALLVATVRPTHLLHAAWIATPGQYLHAAENLDWLAAGLALARAFGEQGGERFVGVGSSAEYAPDDAPCREDDTPIRPATLYGQSKAACWQAVHAAATHYGVSAAWGRVFLPYGPGDAPQRLIPSLVAALKEGRAIETSHGLQERDFVFVSDIAAMFSALLKSPASGAFNIGSGRGEAVRTVIERLADHFGGREGLRFGARPLAPGEPMHLVADMSKTRAVFAGIEPLSLSEGLTRIFPGFAA